ncbi:NF-kappa-B inhibitor cactus-like isoform X2 [Toxorhynchites rutilus septentrionalis]|nr:NF-kappa-B inhibitor cactus-like isoform X2 [Toxorhynchites rutilus septentrionalis]
MYPSKTRQTTAAGGSHPKEEIYDDKLATDSDAIDSGFLSGQLSSDDFISSTEIAKSEALSVEKYSHSTSQKPATAARVHQEEDSQTFDSGVDLESSQQPRSSDPKLGDNVGALCDSFVQLKMNQKVAGQFEKYFYQNDDGDTYLHLAIIHEATAIVTELLRVARPPWLDIQNDFGQTPLHLAILTGQPKIVRQLVAAGAKLGLRDVEGNTPLHLACLRRRVDCVKNLLTPLSVSELQKISPAIQALIKIPQDLEQWNYDGKRCVHIAAETSDIEIVRYLVNAGADINSREGKAGYTPLHIAIEMFDEKLAVFLLEKCPKLRLEQTTYAGLTAYQLAAMLHNQNMLKGLISRGAEQLSPPESDSEEYDSEEDDQ